MKILKSLIIAVFSLTVIDVFCTAVGVRAGVVSEVNPILGQFMQHRPMMCALCICAFVGLMLAVIYHFGPRVAFTAPLLYVLCGVKLWVIGLHVMWIRLAILGA